MRITPLSCLLLALQCTLFAQQSRVQLDLSTTKSSYLVGEPIELQLTVSNLSSDPILIAADYPHFVSVMGIKGTAEASRPVRRPDLELPVLDKVVSFQPVASGSSWSVNLYAQRYLSQPLLTSAVLDYKVAIGIEDHLKNSQRIVQSGSLQILLIPTTQPGLSAALANLWSTHYARTSDYWLQRAVEEAMCVIDTPLAIPYLARLHSHGLTSDTVPAMAKFRGNPEAEQVLLNVLKERRSENVVAALQIFQDWDYVVPADLIAGVLAKPAPWVQKAALKYAGAVGDLAYLPAVADRTADVNLDVAKQALQVRDQLIARGRWR